MKYSEWLNGNYRVYKGLAWIEVSANGDIVNDKHRKYMSDEFSDADIIEAAETVKGFTPAPFETAFLRFGRLPKGGRSKNYATGEMEQGVSCYALTWDAMNGCYTITGSGLAGAIIAYTIKGAPVYIISGEKCGTGSDGEPVIRNAKVLAEAVYDNKKNGYIVK